MSDQRQFPGAKRDDQAARDLGAASIGLAIASSSNEPHLNEYLRVLYKRRWSAATALVVVLVSAVVYTFTVTPVFEARAQLLIEAENPNVISFKEVIEQEKATSDYYQTQYRILQSRTLARRTLDKLAMWDRFDATKQPPKSGAASVLAAPVAYVASYFKPAKQIEAPAAGETADPQQPSARRQV
jgi:uncharacterized protein involved in exopolysaccharide biosynthesis